MRKRTIPGAVTALFGALALLSLGCPPPEEKDVGDKLQEAMENAGEALNEAADEMEEGAQAAKEALREAGDELKEDAEKAKEELEEGE